MARVRARSWFGRSLVSLLTMTVMAAALAVPVVVSTAGSAAAAPPPVPHPPIALYAGYAGDATGNFWAWGSDPGMWAGSPGVTFYGVSSNIDAAAIRLDNISATPLTFDKVTVTAGATTYDLWPSNMNLAAGGHLILTGTVAEPGENFDLSDSIDCTAAPGSLPMPVVSVTVGGVTHQYPDMNRVLFDLPSCGGPEGVDWQLMGPGFLSTSRSEANQRGGGTPADAQDTCNVNVADPVNCATGNLWETVSDLTVVGRGRALEMDRTYNAIEAATATAPDALGWGWTHSYAPKVSVDSSAGTATVTQGNGATVIFTSFGSGYTAPQWVLATLVHNADGTWTFTLPDQRADQFDASGRLTTETDRNGYVTTLAYSGGRLATVTDPAGRTLTFSYDGAGHLSGVADPAGRAVAYGYDGAGNLTSVTDPAGHVTAYAYDASHRLTSVTAPGGGVTTNTYDASHRVVAQTDPLGRTTTLAYSGSTTTVTDPAGAVTTKTFDAQGNLTAMTVGFGTPQAATWSYVYDAYSGERTSTTDPLGRITTETWDPYGNRLGVTDPLGHVTKWAYDGLNDVTSQTDPAGVTTTTTYDAYGNLTSTSTPLVGSSPAVSQTTSLAYDPTRPGDLVARTDPTGRTWAYLYDAAGNLTVMTDPAGDRTTYGYDAIGWRTSTVSPRGNLVGAVPAAFTTTVAYDALGNPTTVTDPLGGTTTTVYDNNQNRTAVTDPNGHTTTYTYDAADQATGMTRADGTSTSTTYTAAGDVASQVDGLGRTTSYVYDALRRVTSATDPLGRVTTYGYDKAGNRTTVKDPIGRTTTFAYDAANRRTATTYSDGATPNVSIGYDVDGQRTSMIDGMGTSSFVYDSLHRLTRATTGNSRTVTYGYDLAGRLTSIGYPPALLSLSGGGLNVGTGTVTRAYDTAGRMASVTDWLGNTTSFAYDADSHQVGTTYPDHTAEAATYDPAGRLSRLTDTGPSGVLLDLPYGRDAAGLLTSDNLLGTTPAVTQTYAYDATNRLAATSVGPAAAGVFPRAYGYDAADDLTRITTAVGVDTLAYDAANQLTTRTNTGGSTTTYSYDPDGNRLNSATHNPTGTTTKTYAYDQANRLVTYAGPLANTINQQLNAQLIAVSYTYDGDGLRSDFIWDRAEGLPLPLLDSVNVPAATLGNVNAYVTGPGGLPLERLDPTNGVLYYHHDQLGSTRALTDKDGHLVQTYTYDPYGNATPANASVVNSVLFAGQYTDSETNLIYLRARYYDPGTGQFISRDPIESLTGAPYNYVANNPLNDTDPLGLMCFSPNCLVNDVKHVAGAVQAGADVVAVAALPIPVVGEVVAGGALIVSEGAGAVGSVAACTQWATGDGSGRECLTDVAINVGTAGVGRIVAPGTVRDGERAFTTAEKGTQAGINLFGDLLGWALGSSSRNAGYLTGQKPCDPGPRFEQARQ